MKLMETQSQWGNLYRTRHYVNGKRVSERDFNWELNRARARGNLERKPLEATSYGFRLVWVEG